MRDAEKEWLANLKVGDMVALSVAYSRRFRVVPIDRETPKYWVVDHTKFDKESGRGIGGDKWNGPSRLHMPTPEMAEEDERHQLAESLNALNWKNQSLLVLRAVDKALKAAQAAQMELSESVTR